MPPRADGENPGAGWGRRREECNSRRRGRGERDLHGVGPLTEATARTQPKASALLFAATPAAGGGPAATLSLDGGTILGHLLRQLESLGVARAWVVTRPEWESAVKAAVGDSGVDLSVVVSDDARGDLHVAADVAERSPGTLIVLSGHVVTHREALAGLVAEPRRVSAIFGTRALRAGVGSLPVRTVRGRVVSAGSAYHRVDRPNAYFLGVLKVEARDIRALAAAARELAALVNDRGADGRVAGLDRAENEWRVLLWRMTVERETGRLLDRDDAPDAQSLRFDAETESELTLRRAATVEDVVPLLLVGLVRSGVHLARSGLRDFFYATPMSQRAAALAAEEMGTIDEDRLALSAAVKARDGFFTTFFVSPYSKYLARFAARRGWTPNAITTVSLVIGTAAAASFALGDRVALVVGAILLQVSFTVDCVDGQLARYTRTFSRLGAWLDSIFDRTKEYVVYAGLAVGSTRGFGDDVWLLAAAALALQTGRHMVDFAYAAREHEAIAATPRIPLDQPDDAPVCADLRSPEAVEDVSAFDIDAPFRGGAAVATQARARRTVTSPAVAPTETATKRQRRRLSALPLRAVDASSALERWTWSRWAKRIVVLPIGERFALISVTAAIATPRVTFVALLAWGSVAAAYGMAARVLAALAR